MSDRLVPVESRSASTAASLAWADTQSLHESNVRTARGIVVPVFAAVMVGAITLTFAPWAAPAAATLAASTFVLLNNVTT